MESSYLHRKMKTIYFVHYVNYHLKMFSSSRYYYCLKINVKSVFILERFVHKIFHPYIQEEEMIIFFFDNSILMSITFHKFSLCFHAVMWKSNLLIFFAIWKECDVRRRRNKFFSIIINNRIEIISETNHFSFLWNCVAYFAYPASICYISCSYFWWVRMLHCHLSFLVYQDDSFLHLVDIHPRFLCHIDML